MTSDEIRAFVHRDWEAVAALKTAYWADRFRREGWRPAWAAADALLLDMRRTCADYPREEDRALDWAAHLTLRGRLDRAADAFAGR